MNDRGGDRPREDRGRGGERGGPPGTEWLQLEPSRVIHGRAEALATEAAEEILKEAIKARLRERLGPRLEEIARLAADALADDLEANLEIEAKIAARREARRMIDRKVDAIFGRRPEEPPGEITGEGWDPRRL